MTRTATHTTAPAWYAQVATERQGHWNRGDSKWEITRQTGYADPIQVLRTDGTVVTGVMMGERNRWDGKHAVAVRKQGAKRNTWLPVAQIQEIWADTGVPLIDLLQTFVETHR